jgi:hypothetical protein
MQSLQVVHIITTGIQSVVKYSGFNSSWPGVTTAMQNSELLCVKASGTYNYHWYSKCEIFRIQLFVAWCHHSDSCSVYSWHNCTSVYSYLKFVTLAQFLFILPLLYLSFDPPLVQFTRCFSKCSSSNPDAPFILLQQSHFTSAVLTRVTQITPSRGHNWKRSAHVNYASSLRYLPGFRVS